MSNQLQPSFFLPNTNRPMMPYIARNIFQKHDITEIQNILNEIPFEKPLVDNQEYNLSTEENSPSKGEENLDVRISKIKWILPNENNIWLFDKITNLIKQANNINYKFDIIDAPHIDIQYTEYHGNVKGKYDWHGDTGEGYPSWRKLSTTILLSDPKEVEGGEFQFFIGGKEETVTMDLNFNDMVVFPSYMIHRVSPITKGIRRSLVMWVGGCPFR